MEEVADPTTVEEAAETVEEDSTKVAEGDFMTVVEGDFTTVAVGEVADSTTDVGGVADSTMEAVEGEVDFTTETVEEVTDSMTEEEAADFKTAMMVVADNLFTRNKEFTIMKATTTTTIVITTTREVRPRSPKTRVTGTTITSSSSITAPTTNHHLPTFILTLAAVSLITPMFVAADAGPVAAVEERRPIIPPLS